MMLRLYGEWFLFFALVAGVLRKFGKPVFAKSELRKYIFSENFQMMGFMSVSSISSGVGSMMLYGPVFIHGYLTCGKILEQPDQITGPWRLLLIRPITALFEYGKVNRRDLIILRSDLEVYTGFYLIIGWFLGMSTIISIVLYWQCLRVRSMLNNQTMLAFTRFDQMFYQ